MYKSQKERIRRFLKTDFEKELCDSIFKNLEASDNKLRFNNFAYSLRELTRHLLYRLAPNEKVLNCSWYNNEIQGKENGITRAQRIKYAVQGGMDNNFVINTLGIDLKQLNKNWKNALDIFNKHTHINEKSFNITEELIEKYVAEAVNCFEHLFEIIERSRELVIGRLEQKLERKIIDKVLEEHFEEIGELATHYETNGIEANEYHIVRLDDKHIEICVTGDIDVTLQYGSNYDIRNDDGLRIEKLIPFHAHLIENVGKINKANPKLIGFKVEPEEPEISDEELERLIDEELNRREENE